MSETFDLVILDGERAGEHFKVTEAGLRLGRSNSCEISIPDPGLSRNHCLFELRAGSIWVTDLASANGTQVNDEDIGDASRELKRGDIILAGETRVGCGDETLAAGKAEVSAPVDLGLHPEGQTSDKPEPKPQNKQVGLLWGLRLTALASVGVMLYLVLGGDLSVVSKWFGGSSDDAAGTVRQANAAARILGVVFEKVDADEEGIYRYALSVDASGNMQVDIDDVPKQNRHVRKTTKLSKDAIKRLNEIFANAEFYRLEAQYSGLGTSKAELKSRSFRVIRDYGVFNVVVENAIEPDAFREVREQLEAFSKNELGIWAIQYSAERLQEMSDEAKRAADAKWEERDVQYGNVAEALEKYDEAVFLLETVNPKPPLYAALVERRREVQAELKKRYAEQRFLADRAINLGDWDAALRELKVLCEMVPDVRDERNAEARAKLLDVESRMRKQGKR